MDWQVMNFHRKNPSILSVLDFLTTRQRYSVSLVCFSQAFLSSPVVQHLRSLDNPIDLESLAIAYGISTSTEVATPFDH